jgi:hypothetical protein
MVLLLIVLIPFINIVYYEYRVLKGVGKDPIDLTKRYGILMMRRKLKSWEN